MFVHTTTGSGHNRAPWQTGEKKEARETIEQNQRRIGSRNTWISNNNTLRHLESKCEGDSHFDVSDQWERERETEIVMETRGGERERN